MKYLITFSDIYRETKVYIPIAHLLSNVILTRKKLNLIVDNLIVHIIFSVECICKEYANHSVSGEMFAELGGEK